MPTGSSSGDAPTVGLRERKKTIAKQALRRAAFDLFTTQGFEATTVEDIARRADVSRASFFRYFTAKEDVLAADDAERREAFFDLLDKENKPLLAGLHAAVSAYLAGMDAEALAHAAAYTRIMVSSRVVLGQAYENRIRWLSELETHVRGRLGRRGRPGRRRAAGRRPHARRARDGVPARGRLAGHAVRDGR